MNSQATPDSPPPSPNPELAAELQKVQKDLIETQEKVLGLREREIFALREQVSGLNLRINVITVVAGIIVGLLTFFGIKQYRDFQELIETKFQQQFDRSFGFYDKLMHAQVLVNDRKFEAGESEYRQLFEMRPQDEIVFFNLLNCLEFQNDFGGAVDVVENAKKSGLFPSKCRFLWSFNNAGCALLIKSLDQPAKLNDALWALQRAEQIGMNENDSAIEYPYVNLAICYAAMGDMEKMKYYAQHYRELHTAPYDLSKEPWFKKLQEKRPHEAQEVQKAFTAPAKP